MLLLPLALTTVTPSTWESVSLHCHVCSMCRTLLQGFKLVPGNVSLFPSNGSLSLLEFMLRLYLSIKHLMDRLPPKYLPF